MTLHGANLHGGTHYKCRFGGEPPAPALGGPLLDLLLFTAFCLALASWRYSRTEYESRSRD